MASPLVQVGWLQATVPIENEWGHRGTGFLVTRETGGGKGRIFLVTNKHVVHPDPKLREGATRVRSHFNTRAMDGTPGTLAVDVALRSSDGRAVYREHPDVDTDVLAVHVTDVIVANPETEKRWARYRDFGDRALREQLDITAGEDVVTIGYPLGLRQGDTNLPLLRQGMIATRIGDVIRDRVLGTDGKQRSRTLRAFLIDGGFVPGSSGSPVVLKPVIGRHVKGDVVLGTAPAVLLGIVAETKYAPIQTDAGAAAGFAGLGLAFEAEPFAELLAFIRAQEAELQAIKVPDVHFAPSSANPQEFVVGLYGQHVQTATGPANAALKRMAALSANIAPLRGAVSKMTAELHEFVARTFYELAFKGVAESIFDAQEKQVDALLAQTAGEALEKTPAIAERLAAGDQEAVSHGMSSCRLVASLQHSLTLFSRRPLRSCPMATNWWMPGPSTI